MSALYPHIAATLAAHQLFASAGPDPEAWRELKACGVDLDLVTNLAGPIVRIVATFLPDGTFIGDDFGEVAFCMALHGEDAESVVDLVAWSARDPATFGTQFGAGVLGLDCLVNPASYIGHPCCLYSTPLGWLQAGCAGTAVLDHAAARTALQAAPGQLTADTMDYAVFLIRSGTIVANRLLVPATWRAAA